MAWSQSFVPPIPLPGGGEFVTLSDARAYILALPEAEVHSDAWHAALEALLLVGNHDGDPMLARIGMMRALCPDLPEPTEPRRKRAKQYRIIQSQNKKPDDR